MSAWRIVEKKNYLPPLEERFGFPPGLFDPYELIWFSKKRLMLTTKERLPEIAVTTPGMDFLNIKGKIHKLSTAAARRFGPFATQNLLQLGPKEARQYCQRIELTWPSLPEGVQSRGYVIVGGFGGILALGFIRLERGLVRLESLFPTSYQVGSFDSWHLPRPAKD